jgi:hypothetical protein
VLDLPQRLLQPELNDLKKATRFELHLDAESLVARQPQVVAKNTMKKSPFTYHQKSYLTLIKPV